MANPCGCGDSNPVSTQNTNQVQQVQQDPLTPCPVTVHEEVCVQATVTIRPDVQILPIRSFCRGPARINQPCVGTPQRFCTFTVSQNICVEIPLTFSVTPEAVPTGIVCGIPMEGPCVPDTFVCCQFIQAQQGEFNGRPLNSLSIQLCGPENQCSPQGNHINIVFPGATPNINLNQGEITSMTCAGEGPTRVVTVTAQDNFGGELTNFTFTFTPNANGTVNLVVLAVNAADPTDTFTATITLTGPNLSFQPCTP
ncbi:hypothetical protein [Ureibacillus manganicus]|uniref:Uncharacterized protein n=1 Tax=Ureibacillus manganicus DSM 26584 TaxID=1384049 RepID=A0A0A3IZS0_9BACL|nr:hypothetical protein [Ureibacillus manganicus]KGR80272.1 hypothetical protein CD29_02650 [Ureibacillus manganicus DSM 26584]